MTAQNQSQRIQLNLDLSLELYETINNMAQKINADNAEVLLKAITLLELAVEAKHQGKHIWITDDNQNIETEIVGI
ncbi:DNA-binding protein [Nostoc sp. UHCC 0702]|nr:DNA-binding protein [Nostoc sp. UHCC 0702]